MNLYTVCSKKTTGYKKGRKERITPETRTVIEGRRTLKKKLSNAKSKRLKESLKAQYQKTNTKVKRLVRKDKRNHLDELASARGAKQ